MDQMMKTKVLSASALMAMRGSGCVSYAALSFGGVLGIGNKLSRCRGRLWRRLQPRPSAESRVDTTQEVQRW